MPAFLKDNLPYKAAALIFAVLLHFYVAGQQSPVRVWTVPLMMQNLPTGLLPSDDAPRQVTLSLSGPADALDRVSPADVTADIDLAHAHTGRNIVPVLVKAPDELRADPTPDTVTLSLLPLETRRLGVAAADPGLALSGYQYEAPEVSPRAVTVSGSQDAVDSVARLVVNADGPASVGTVNGEFGIVALDARGSQVPDVTLTPSHAHVVIPMVSAPAVKNVIVTADIAGSLPPSSQITGVDVSPRLVVISGSPSRLAQIKYVGTAPVDVSSAVTDVTRTVVCVPPPGVAFTGARAVTVTVHIAPSPGATPAAPPPAPVAAPAPVTPAAPPPPGVTPVR